MYGAAANMILLGRVFLSLAGLVSSVERRRINLSMVMTMNQNWAINVQKA